MCGKCGLLLLRAQDPTVRIDSDIKMNLPWVEGMVLCDRHVCYYRECRDLLKERFRHMMDFHDFHA